ncbi:family 1 glycosyltransferase [Xylariales sp. PMI_506]|nr:family 1 glycosyltransferase [Xylariales sp. PMI_506]
MMGNKISSWISVPAALLTLCIAVLLMQSTETYPPSVQGRNNTVLFLSNTEPGLSNVVIATAAALFAAYPDIEVHYASFPSLGPKISEVAGFARSGSKESYLNARSDNIIFHPLTSAPKFQYANIDLEADWSRFIHPPGPSGVDTLVWDLEHWMSIWNPEQHLALYHEIRRLIEDEIDPAVVVIDPLFRPAYDAVRDSNRLQSTISPNLIANAFIHMQPWGSMFWKFAAIGADYAVPLHFRHIPGNIYQSIRIIWSQVIMPDTAKDQYLKDHGVRNPVGFKDLYKPNTPWITPDVVGATLPVQYIPENVTVTGPIILPPMLVEEQDRELVAWLKRSPTMLINLGSTTMYDEQRTSDMANAILSVLDAKPDMQVLWKYQPIEPLRHHIESGRVIITTWLDIDPTSLLHAGLIDISVHHGGSSCYWESVAAGVPQVVFPLWCDHYNFARVAEQSGLGIYGCQGVNPYWTSECLSEALLAMAKDDATTRAIRQRARELGDAGSGREPGRITAARRVAELAASGR